VSLQGELVLADDVEIVAIADLPRETRDMIAHEEDDFAVSRPRSRDPSRLIDGESRELLREFEQPTRIVDAVIRFATRRGADPQATLEGAFAMFDRLYRASILVPPEKRVHHDAEPRLEPGRVIFGVTLGHRVHYLDDTEVFFARDAAGRALAVKIVRGPMAGVAREAEAMRQAGSRVPEVVGVHEWEGRGVLVAEWVFGEDVTHAATALRGHREARTEAGLLALSCDVVDAMVEIHRAGLLHGDIHPRNVLIEKGGRARIIDLGLSVHAREGASPGARGGVAFYMEPELAVATLRGQSVPSTAAGEQYALGALVYLLWTGCHYLDWSLERMTMLRQIAEEPLVPFARRHVPEWPELEAVLRRALEKGPGARFASCADFGHALRVLLPEARRRDGIAAEKTPPARRPGGDLTSAFFERCGLGGVALRERPLNPPFASLNYGAAGIAYAMYELAVARDDAGLLATADVWAQKATVLSREDEAFHTRAIEINEKTVGNASLFHSPSGVHAVRALVALASGEAAGAAAALTDFVAASRVPCEFIDLTLGKAGLLVGCAALLEAMRGSRHGDPSALEARGTELRDEVRRAVQDAAFATSPSIPTLGLAHGWAGLLFALLRWSQASGEPAEPYRGKLDELAALREPWGAGIRWPVSNRTVARSSYMDGWCNGAAGHTLLWALAHERLGDSEYGVHAERSASAAWSSSVTVGTLCCGLAGIGYACAAAHRVTGDAAWLARARIAAERACEDRSKWFYRDSLYKGAVGAVLLREELDASHAATPLVEASP